MEDVDEDDGEEEAVAQGLHGAASLLGLAAEGDVDVGVGPDRLRVRETSRVGQGFQFGAIHGGEGGQREAVEVDAGGADVREKAAVDMQRCGRGMLGRRRVGRMKAEKEKEDKAKAAEDAKAKAKKEKEDKAKAVTAKAEKEKAEKASSDNKEKEDAEAVSPSVHKGKHMQSPHGMFSPRMAMARGRF